VGIPVLLLDLTKRSVMTERLPKTSQQSVSTAASRSTPGVALQDGHSGPAVSRRRQIEWYRKIVENEERKRVKENLPDYDWDVCMIAHFHDGSRHSLACRAHRTHCTHLLRRTHLTWCAAGCAVLFDDGDYQSSETPAQKTSLRVKDELWQAIDRAKLSHPLLNDDDMPGATAEQVRTFTLPKVFAGCLLR